MKLCKDCINVQRDAVNQVTEQALCMRFVREDISPVTGNVYSILSEMGCAYARVDKCDCGPRAIYFIPNT